jgi:hypothetical protein
MTIETRRRLETRGLFWGALLLLAQSGTAQVLPPMSCSTSAVPALLRAEGKAELVADIVLTCTGGSPSIPMMANFSLFLNTNVTSNLTGPGPNETEALLLIDEPQPSPAANVSNGFFYAGQVKGTPGIPAGAPASGNVYTGSRTGAVNQLVWTGTPIVPPGLGTRRFRFTNVRALPPPAAATGVSAAYAFIAISGPSSIGITNPVVLVGFPQQGLKFQATIGGSLVKLQFSELFASAFKKRIENTPAGPTSPAKQNVPGSIHCTESGFNPDFTTFTPGDTGSANTGTRFVAKLTSIPPGIAQILAPNSVPSPSLQLTARRVDPPYGASFDGGALAPSVGTGSVPVIAGAATLVYEVLAAAPFKGVNGCAVLDGFSIAGQAWPPLLLFGTKVSGSFGPINATTMISGPAPEPRF